MEKLLGSGDPKKGEILQEGEDTVSLGIFSSWGVAIVTTVTFNDILVIVFLFPLNVGVSLCFQCTVLVPVTGYILSVCIMQVLLLVSA